MHRNHMFGAGFFDEIFCAINKDVGSQNALDHVQNARIRGQTIRQWHHRIRVYAFIGIYWFWQTRIQPIMFQLFQFASRCCGLVLGHDLNRKQISVVPIVLNLVL